MFHRDELLIDLSESGHQRSHSFTDLRAGGVAEVSGQLRGSVSSLNDPVSSAFPEYCNIDTSESPVPSLTYISILLILCI